MKKFKYLSIRLSGSLLLCLIILLSCKKSTNTKRTFKNILIIGNSITKHSPAPQIGWYGNWGMAASDLDSDYVNILTRRFLEENPNTKVKCENIANFEATYWQYDLSSLDSLKVFKPTLIIIRIGENVDRTTVDEHEFKRYYTSLIQYFKKDNLDTKVVCVGSFWKIESVENAIKNSALETNSTYVKINSLDDIKYMAWDEFIDLGVHIHPSNKGMSAIADSIWNRGINLQ
jgi:hypothetical protein